MLSVCPEDIINIYQKLEKLFGGVLKTYSAILLCGGKGTRLRELTKDEILKPLLKVAGKELINYSIELFEPNVVNKLVFAVDHKAEQIETWIKNQDLGYKFEISKQIAPGVLQALKDGSTYAENDIIFCNTDEIRKNLNLKEVIRTHEKFDALATVVCTYTNNLFKHGVIQLKDDFTVSGILIKDKMYQNKPLEVGLVNSGFVVMKKEAIKYLDGRVDKDWNGITTPLISMGELKAYIDERIVFFNSNTAEQYYEAENYLKDNSGKN
ncbi:MAG: NTP transferase domain-containing protein [Candidatus Micrarchaeota archaeon]|nr:NTP transferase domain-containing protein [Candidatus Micrarchaeota archaeon]